MIQVKKDVFYLATEHTSYLFRVCQTGHLEQLYYGARIPLQEDMSFLGHNLITPYGDTVAYSQEAPAVSLEHMRLEYSTFGKGDFKEPSIQLSHSDTCYVTDFKYVSYEILNSKFMLEGMPSSYGNKAETLKVVCSDTYIGAELELYYTVFSECDVIVRTCRLVNKSQQPIQIHSLMSAQVDLPPEPYTLLTFDGSWIRERHKSEKPLARGTCSVCSNIGTSSNRHNPFFALKKEDCGEHSGECYGFNLVYSGNHLIRVERSPHDIIRIQNGINPFEFEWLLEPGKSFEAPESVMTYSAAGLNGMSRNMHQFVRDHIVRGVWQYRERPILVNNWEATYFFFDEKKIVKLAQKAKSLGAEMFVLDDGWFGKRNNDKSSLGDWYENLKKIPCGIDGLCKKVNGLGLKFGLWVEPEMVSPDSDLYRAHPDWAIETGKYKSSQGRNQLVLDLTRDDVCDYLIETMTKVFTLS
ncbi:MAG: alpha-galactosidase, partial [Clostridiales bacterium]|nr:alpha-galactosidase [Clostridiales bacterium]